MTLHHFEEEMAKIVKRWPAAYPDVRVQLLWKRIKHLSNEWMTATVEYLILYENHAPAMDKWDERIAQERKRSKAYEPSVERKTNCSFCRGHGFLWDHELERPTGKGGAWACWKCDSSESIEVKIIPVVSRKFEDIAKQLNSVSREPGDEWD